MSKPDWGSRAGQVFVPVWKADHPLEIERGEGIWLTDRVGTSYMDFTSGYGPTILGHSHPRVVQAVQRQASRLVHTATTVYTEPILQAAERLLSVVPMPQGSKLHFMNSGAEAVEAAMKLSRLSTGRPGFIAFRGGFHGRTLGALSLTTSKALYRERYEPLVPGVYFAPFPNAFRSPVGPDAEACAQHCLDELQRLFDHVIPPRQVAAVFVEPIQGEGGYIPAPVSFLQELRRVCDAYGIVLVVDEIQTGFGRSGRWFSIEHANIEPDILVVAKALASGLPLSALIAREEIARAWSPGAHGTTYGGNLLACAATEATIDVIKDECLVEHAEELGTFLMSSLRETLGQHPELGDVRGRGLMIGMEFVRDSSKAPWPQGVEQIVFGCRRHGVLLATCGVWSHVIRLLPPLVLTREDAERFLRVFSEVVASVCS